MRPEWHARQEVLHILAALMPPNRLALEVSLATGLRIGDVLSIRTEQLSTPDGRLTVKEQKTGKTHRVRLPVDLLHRCRMTAGRYYVFEGRLSALKPRTRQAVWKDLTRVCRMMRLRAHLTPHSMRRIYAVQAYERTGGNLARVRKLLNHSDDAVTLLYVMAGEQLLRHRPQDASGDGL